MYEQIFFLDVNRLGNNAMNRICVRTSVSTKWGRKRVKTRHGAKMG